jgi:hydroxymethylpyrimidine kinase/phosphomethylpyrimidine kinase
LTIGGSDSSGGSGVQADLRTFATLGVQGLTAVTVVTARDRRGLRRAHPVPPRMVAAQIDAVVRDGGVDAAKTGMLGSWQMVAVVAERVRRRRVPNLVVDPAMTTDGARTLGAQGADLLRRRLLPLARLVTPSAQEAEWLTGKPVRDPAGMRAAAEALGATGVGAVLIRGGGLPGTPPDLFYESGSFHELPVRPEAGGGEDVPSAVDRLTAALAARLALGDALLDALVFARAFVAEG